MKELSIEEKAKAYDEAIKVANKYKDTHIMFPSIKDEMFPELKESEDEKIRLKLIEAVKGDMVVGGTKDKQLALAWLEKQGEQKPAWKPSDKQMELLREVQQALLGKDCHNRFVDFMYELKRLREE